LALLIAVIALLARGRWRTAQFADFSLTILQVGRNEAYVQYRSNDKQTELPASIGRGRTFFRSAISIGIPTEVAPEDLPKIISDVVFGLAKLRYEYRIYRNSEVLARSDTWRFTKPGN